MEKKNPSHVQRVLITGASKGIGKAIAQKLSQFPDKFQVHGTSRNIQSIPSESKLPNVTYHNLELSDPASIHALISAVPDVDILINNAGCSHNGPIEELPLDRSHHYFEINFFGAVALIQGYLPSMRTRRKGFIINISSMAGKTPVPFTTMYAASKSALISLTLGLENELHSFGIKVTTIAPFEIQTGITQEIIYGPDSEYAQLSKVVKQIRDDKIAHGPTPDIVGDLVMKILHMRRPKSFYPVGRKAPFKYFIIKHLPNRIVARGTRKLFNLP